MSLTALISACSSPPRNQNTIQVNVNASAMVNAPKTNFLYSAPPVPRVSKSTPTAIEVSQVLKRANIFPKENGVRETTLSDLEKAEGTLTSVVVESFHPKGTTIKVFETSEKRNEARIRMVNACPGCNFLIECGPILVYEPTANDRETNIHNHALYKERYGVLRQYFNCD